VSALRNPKVIGLTVLAVVVMIAGRLLMPVTMPQITLAPEPLVFFGALPFTNTMLALLLSELVLLGLAFLAGRRVGLEPSRLQNFFEMVVEFWEDQSKQLIGDRLARTWLPLILTTFLLIWFSNYMHFLPGFESVGLLCTPGSCPEQPAEATVAPAPEAEAEADHTVHKLFDVRWTGGSPGEGVGLITGKLDDEAAAAEAVASGNAFAFVPFLRVAASDLNFTFALALIAFVVIELVGFREWGPRYVTKFVHIDFRHGIGQGLLALFVGLIELISELARIISFAFRLFGNVFAGGVLLVVFMFLTPLLLVIPIYGLELFVGLIQAFVFAILILAFMTLALSPLHGDDEH
jgi:F-type H+-transporting ATPase subunit a